MRCLDIQGMGERLCYWTMAKGVRGMKYDMCRRGVLVFEGMGELFGYIVIVVLVLFEILVLVAGRWLGEWGV